MANKDRNKRSARQARQREHAEREALAAQAAASSTKGKATKAAKASSSEKKTAPVKASATKKTGVLGRVRSYFGAVRGEMRRVTWPSRPELTNYSVAVVAMLAVFGLAVWAIDTGFVALLVAFTSLRG